MSISALTLALYHSKATYTKRLVLLAIANFEGEYGAFPSHDTIGRLAGGINRRTVQKNIEELIEMGELMKVKRDGITNLYHVTLRCPDGCDGTTQHRVSRRGGPQTAGGLQAAGGGGLQAAGGAVSRPHEPLDNRKKNREGTLDPNWEPDQHLMDMFQSKWPDLNSDYHIEQFKLHYLSKGTKLKDWSMAFQRWMNQEQDRATRNPRFASGVNEKKRKVRDLEDSKEFLREQEELARQAAPAPKCEHGNNVALCVRCLGKNV